MQQFRFKPSLPPFAAQQYNGPPSIARNAPHPDLPAGMQWNTFGVTIWIYPVLLTQWGNEPVNPTDWIVDAEDGTRYKMSDTLFKMVCDPVAQNAGNS